MPATPAVPIEILYRTSTMLEGFAQIPPVSVFLRDRLFSRVRTTETDLVSVEFMKGRAKLSPFCSRFSKGTAVARERVKLSVFAPPWTKPVRMLTVMTSFEKAPRLRLAQTPPTKTLNFFSKITQSSTA